MSSPIICLRGKLKNLIVFDLLWNYDGIFKIVDIESLIWNVS